MYAEPRSVTDGCFAYCERVSRGACQRFRGWHHNLRDPRLGGNVNPDLTFLYAEW
ncbi:hypothetical protein BH18ACT14_BH18ACT14_04360 [soil metagenome]